MKGKWARKSWRDRLWSRVDKSDRCWLWMGHRNALGYGKLSVEGRFVPVHRAAWIDCVGEIPDGLFVCHRCDNPPCVNPAHLFLGTQEDNVADRDAKNRTARGESQGGAKLTDDTAREILDMLADGISQTALAKEYGITQGAISHMVCGRTWNHITGIEQARQVGSNR